LLSKTLDFNTNRFAKQLLNVQFLMLLMVDGRYQLLISLTNFVVANGCLGSAADDQKTKICLLPMAAFE
jgi:hypothetical protein